MKFIKTEIPEVVIIEPKIWDDERGLFFESFRNDLFDRNIKKINFVQDNESISKYGSLRGLHFQLPPFAQSKLVRVIKGKIIDVAIDIRKGSPTFAKFVTIELSENNKKQIFIPRGFAHGFIVISEECILNYKVDNYYSKESERGIIYSDKTLNIDWRINKKDIVLSEKDKILPDLYNTEMFNYSDSLY
ncbi:MAG: dTDP-4-dehydrorhamnose 3,5-epimerase [Candidatus Firestonebacteria bacterium]|nr:dTDP-4-dehydrorhamnose 3,5-epimerase [Candidatus Firestonebacteria bacterium]